MVYPGYVKTPITLHALRGDGEAFGQMGEAQARGISPDACARTIVAATAKNRREIYVGGREVAAIYLKRFFPSIVERVVRRYKLT